MTPPPPPRLKALASKKSLAARQNNSAFLSGKLGRPVSGEDIYAGPIPMPLSQLRDVYPTITENVKWSDGFLEHELCEEESPEVLDSNPSESTPPPPDKIDPQSGVEFFSAMERIKQLSASYDKMLSMDIMREIEGIVSVLIALKDCASIEQFFSIVFLYVRSHTNQAVSTICCDYIKDIFSDETVEQSGEEHPQWLTYMRDMQQNWALLKGNKMFKQVSKLLGVLVTLGLCEAAALEFSIAGYKLFDESVLEQHQSAFDMFDAVFGTITYFAEGAYLCFKQGSVRPLLMNDSSAAELDDEYMRILQWWDLVQNGNLEKFTDVSQHEFDHRLEMLITALKTVNGSLKGYDKKIIGDRITKLLLIKNSYVSLQLGSGIREAPFCIELFGDSAQGKTTFGETLIDALLVANDWPLDPIYRGTIDPSSNYMDQWTTDKLVATVDDMSNEKPEFVQSSPARFVIDGCNNAQYVVKKANLEGKGKVLFQPKFFVVTTNKKNMDAKVYSNCPYSVQRRMHVVITVQCKDEFQVKSKDGIPLGVDSAKIEAMYTDELGEYHPPVFDDIWTLTVERAVKPQKMDQAASYEPIIHNGKPLVDVDTRTVIQYCIEAHAVHLRNQKRIVERNAERGQRFEKCPTCTSLKGVCDCEQISAHFGLDLAGAITTSCGKVTEKVRTSTDLFTSKIETVATTALLAYTTQFIASWDWMALVPRPWLKDKYFSQFLAWWYKDNVYKKVRSITLWNMFYVFLSLLLLHPFFVLLVCMIVLIRQVFVASVAKNQLTRELEKRTDILPAIVKNVRDTYWQQFAIICGSLVSLVAIVQVVRHLRQIQQAHGALEPKTEAEVEARSAESNPWLNFTPQPLPVTKYSKCITRADLMRKVRLNLRYGSCFVENGKTLMVDGFFLRSNVVFIPNHYFAGRDEFTARFTYEKPGEPGNTFESQLSTVQSVLIPGTDLRLCYSATGGSFKDLTDYFPVFDAENKMVDHPFEMQYRKKGGDVVTMKGTAVMGMQNNSVCSFYGGKSRNLTHNTFEGLCGAVVVSATAAPCISGLHLGGTTHKPIAVFGSVSKQEIELAIEKLRKIDGVILSGDAGTFCTEQMGVKIVTNAPMHHKSPLNFIPSDHESQLRYHGSCIGQTTSKTEVKKTLISDHVTDVTGVENVWGPPKMNPEWFGWQKCLSNISKPARSFPARLVIRAVRDYKEPLIARIRSLDCWKRLKPLTEQETLCGVPGRKFIDAIKLGTSIGLPLSGPKREHVIELDPTDECPVRREYTPEVRKLIDDGHACYKRGERANPVAKGCKKDEILPLYDESGELKEKCRIFYGNSIVLTHLIRMYYLPIVYFIQMNPLLAEQAVGINALGPEWDEMDTHMMSKGEERTFAGDYSKYDQRMPSQMIFAAFRVLIDMAREMDYSEEDIRVMEAMTGDVVFAYIAFNGDLVGLTEGGHISGNSLTVIINGIAGSLNLRVGYFSIYPECDDFRKHVAMQCYGDDNKGTVSAQRKKFNIKSYSEFLKPYGQSYTMPDKTSELEEWCSDADFLCRKTAYNPRIGKKVGALNDESIFKRLHNYRREKGSPLSDEQACAANVDSALIEWFHHGEEVYNERREQMTEVCKRAEISHISQGIHMSYDERVAKWHEDYSGDN